MLLNQFQTLGHDLFSRGLVASHSGNLSVRMGDKILITRKHVMLNNIGERDLLETGVDRNERSTPLAGNELIIHRCIYRSTSALAIVHAHPPYAVALSLCENEIMPQDRAGTSTLGKIPIINPGVVAQGEQCLDNEISRALCGSPVVIVRGHGTYATGQLLEEAYHRTTVLEGSCHILCLLKSLGVPLQDIQKAA